MRISSQLVWVLRVYVLFWAISGPNVRANGAGSTEEPSSTSVDIEQLSKLHEECAREVERVKATIADLEFAGDTLPPEHLVTELELWERLELIAAQRRSTHEKRLEIEQELKLVQERQQEFERASTITSTSSSSSSFIKLDDIREELLVAKHQAEIAKLELQAEKALLQDAKGQLLEAEQERRALVESLESSDSLIDTSEQRERTLSELRCRVLRAETILHRETCKSLQLGCQKADLEVEELTARVYTMAQNVQFTEEELQKRLKMIDEIVLDIRGKLSTAEFRLRKLVRKRAQVKSTDTSNKAFETARDEIQLLQQILIEVGGIRDCWYRRFDLINRRFEPGEPDDWLADATTAKRHIDRLCEKLRLRTTVCQSELSSLQRRLASNETGEDKLIELNNQISELQRAIEFYSATQVLITGGQRLYERFINELEYHLDELSWSEFVQRISAWIAGAWSYEITSIEDEPITISKIVYGFALLLSGYWVSRLVTAVISSRVLPKFGLSHTAIAPLRTILFYVLLVAFTFVSLDIVNVPLTVFAFMGGAIAIGVGFGSQNILNNFISGLILLVERPIRIGDLVNVDGIDANIEQIGARSTRVRTGSNLEILVPNSKFLENNVTNWTLSDTRIRTTIAVGVAYGSPVKQVITLLETSVRTHPKALENPAPIVLFRDFGSDSLNFEVHFWVHMRKIMDCARIESDIRIKIDEQFKEAGITIAFPQRDVHLDLQTPIEVRMSEVSPLRVKADTDLRAA